MAYRNGNYAASMWLSRSTVCADIGDIAKVILNCAEHAHRQQHGKQIRCCRNVNALKSSLAEPPVIFRK